MEDIAKGNTAAWQTIQHKVVGDYGILEEFVSMVTDFVPELLTSHQRAQLTLGLRARLMLELCRCEATANFDIVQPHVDRMHTLIEAWVMEVDATNMETENSGFLDLIKNILKDPAKREHFFQKVFPEDFGPTFDEALQTLMWLLLSRLEKFLPLQSFQQVASMFVEVSSVLDESMESVSQCEELKTLLQQQKDLSQLDLNDGSLDGVSIISALKLSYVGRIENHKKQDHVLSCTPGLDRASLTVHQTNAYKDHETNKEKTDKPNWTPGSDGPVMLFRDTTTNYQNVDHHFSQAEDASQRLKQCHVDLERLEMPLSSQFRPMRRNRGLNMKKIVLKEKRGLWEEATSPDWAPSEVLDSNSSGTFNKDSPYIAPISNSCEEDSWSYYSEEDSSSSSSSSSSPIMADSWSHYSDDASSFISPVSRSTEDDLWYICSNKDPPFKGPEKISATSKNLSISNMKASSPEKIICKQHMTTPLRKMFSKNSNLLRHLSLIHCDLHDVKRHSCSQCDKSFKEKGALIKHQRSKHLHELFRYPCLYCGKMVAANTLTRHKLMHTGERPFKCTVSDCDKFFRSTSEVKRHVLYHHTTDRPYKCDVCGKGFVNKCFLNAHVKIHSGEKPFVCHICGKAFLQLYSMQRHKNLLHTMM